MTERADLSQYNPAYDSQRFGTLMAQRATVGFETEFATETAYIGQQLKTDLGERLDVSKSTVVYEIKDGKLYEPGREEPFEEVVKRGTGRNPIDSRRDKAVLGTFTTVVQGFLAREDTPDGATVLVASPRGLPGSDEKKNYFDVYLREGKFIISTRYRSDLTNAEYRQKIVQLNPYYSSVLPEKPTDVDLKSTPVVIPSYLDYSNPDALAKFLLGKEIGMPQEELEEVWISVAPIATSYINTLVESPEDLYSLEMTYRALLNATHKTSERVKKPIPIVAFDTSSAADISVERKSGFNWTGTKIEIQMLASEPVKIGGGGCGSGSCSTSSSSVSSEISGSFESIDGRGPLTFSCPECGGENTRPLFSYVTHCQKCGSDKVLPDSVKEKLGLSKVN